MSYNLKYIVKFCIYILHGHHVSRWQSRSNFNLSEQAQNMCSIFKEKDARFVWLISYK